MPSPQRGRPPLTPRVRRMRLEFGRRARAARKIHADQTGVERLTQAALADRLGLPLHRVRNAEQGLFAAPEILRQWVEWVEAGAQG